MIVRNPKLTSSALVSTASSVSLLDGKASTERTGDGVVAASDSANVAGRCAETVELLRHLDVDGKVLFLGLRETQCTRDIVGNLQWRKVGFGVAGLVHVALEWSSTISVDLVDGDCYHGAGRDLGHATGCELILRLLANVDVAGNLSPATRVDNVLLDL